MRGCVCSIVAVGIFLSCFVSSCKKSEPDPIVNPSFLDSAILDDHNVNFIYDSEDRIIEDRLVAFDTLRERNVYEYIDYDSFPFKRTHYIDSNTSPDYISFFQYSNGNKVYDSSYYLATGTYTTVNIDYSLPGKICVLQKITPLPPNWKADTIYLNSNGNIDSIRSYTNIQQPYGPLNYTGTTKFLQYNTQPNYFKALSISRCNFYLPAPSQNWGSPIYYYMDYDFPLAFDFFNANYFTAFSLIPASSQGQSWDWQKHIQYNADNLPVSQTVTTSNGPNATILFLYK